jgi:hypothetical protein
MLVKPTEIVQRVAAQIAALAPRFPQLRDFDVATAVAGLSITYARGVSAVPDPDYARLLAEYEAAVRAEPYRKRRPPPGPTMPSYRPDGISLVISFITAEHARMSAAFRSPERRIGDLFYDLYIDGPENQSFAELSGEIGCIMTSCT